MNANMKAKTEVVKEISGKLNTAQAVVIADYSGLTVAEFQLLRRQLAEKDVELKVYKNRLFKIAAKEAKLEGLESSLTGANVFAFGMSDDISPAKILAAFAKEHETLKLKAGTYEGKVISAVEVNEVAMLPTLEEALTMLATQLLSPVRFVGVGLHQLTQSDQLQANVSEIPASTDAKEETPTIEAIEEVNAEKTKETPAKAEVKEGE